MQCGGTGELGAWRFTTLGTAGNSFSSNKCAHTCGCGRGGGLVGGVDKSRNGNGDTGMDDPHRGVRGEILRGGDARGLEGFGWGFCSWDADLHVLRELFFATTGEMRSLRGGVNPGDKSVSTMDIGDILIGVEKDGGGGGDVLETGLGV